MRACLKRIGLFHALAAVTALLGLAGTVRGQAIVSFADPNLEAAVRAELSKPAGPLTTADLQSLTALEAFARQITNLSGLEYATNLNWLSLGYNAVRDLSPLAQLGNLRYLSLPGNGLSNSRSLSALTQVQSLDVGLNQLRDFSPLLSLTNLQYLDVGFNPITNYTLAAGLPSLTWLDMSQLSISDLGFLNGLTNLLQLRLAFDQIGYLPPIPALNNLTWLDLRNNPLTNAASLAGLTNLTNLELDHCPLNGVNFLPPLTRLQSLYLEAINLGDASPLSGLTNLSTLIVDYNPLTNSAALGSLTNLRVLLAMSCSLTNMDFVHSLIRLFELGLQGNQISDATPALGLASLQYLNLDQNRLTNLAGLDSLPALGTLSVTQNLLDLSPGSAAMEVITNLLARGVSVFYTPQNQPPVIGIPPVWTVPMDTPSTLGFSVSDDVTAADQITVTVACANTNLIPASGLGVDHSYYTTWNLTVQPAAGQSGATTLTLTATDDTGLTAVTNLTVTVFYSPPVAFPDANLEAAVRYSLNKLSGPLTTYDLQSLTYLYTWMFGTVSNLTGLEWATNLSTLYLGNNAVSDLRPLFGLPALQTLDLSYSHLRNLSQVAALTNLTWLRLDGNVPTNPAVLAGLPKLTTLSAASCSLSNLVGIGGLIRLQSLCLNNNAIRDPAPLAGLTNLTYLDLSANPLTGTGALAGLTNLVTLNLTSCSLATLPSLNKLTTLQSLSLGYNNLHDLSSLAGLTNLSYLYLDSNPLASITALGGLSGLMALSLGSCSVTNLAPLQGCADLQALYLQNNGICDLASLPPLPNLNTLYLSGNPLTNVAPLVSLPALNTLDLSNCSFTNLCSVAALTRLQFLNLDYDQITDLSVLLALTNLSSLDLAANRLTDIAAVTNLHRLGWLDVMLNLLDLNTNSPATTLITNLLQQGVYVAYDPQNQPPVFYRLRTNWIIPPSQPADLRFILSDDVTRPDQVTLTFSPSSAGPLSNSTVTLTRTASFSGPRVGTPILLPPPIVVPAQPIPGAPAGTSPAPLDSLPIIPISVGPGGGGVSYWDLHLVPAPNETGVITLTLTATDDTGLSTNATVVVTVAPPQPFDGACLEAADLTWQTGGNSAWFSQTITVHGGSAAAQSGAVGFNEESWLETTVTGPGILSFWWKLASTNYGSYVSFTTSQGGTMALQSPADWRQASLSIPAGACVLRWDFGNSWGGDASGTAWLDQVSFVPAMPDFWVQLGPSLEMLSLPYPVGFAPGTSLPDVGSAGVTLHGEPGGLYEVQFSTNLVRWSVLERVVLDPTGAGFQQWVPDPAAGAGARFYRARQLPPGTTWFDALTFDAGGLPVLQLHSQPGRTCNVLTSTNLIDWSLLATVTTNTTGTLSLPDPQATSPCRFYKAQSQ